MVDIDTHRIIDMIDSRSIDDVSEWLKTYPNLKIISRDGANIYLNAINNYNQDVIQISDRFHLIKNLTEYCKDYLYQYLEKNIKLLKLEDSINVSEPIVKTTVQARYNQAIELINNGKLLNEACKSVSMNTKTFNKIHSLSELDREIYFKTNIEIKISEREENKQKIIDEARRLYEERYSKSKIASILDIDRRTIDKYLKLTTTGKDKRTGQKLSSKLDIYKEEINNLFHNNYKSREIYQVILEKGYKGSYSNLRTYLSEFKKNQQKIEKIENQYVIIKRKVLLQLLYKPLDKVDSIDKQNLLEIYTLYPNYKKIIELIREFKSILKKGNQDYLLSWINKVLKLNIKELNSFINGINRDILAVLNAVKYDYSNGLAEGSVNKTKLVKRIMYGRSSFETLKSKVLRLEFYRFFN